MAGCEKFQESKDIGKFPGNHEQIGLDEKQIPENDALLIRGSINDLHGGHQTVLAGDSQERKGRETSAFMMAPERDLGLNPPSSQRPSCQTLQEQRLHSRTLSPFAVTPSRLLAEPTESVEENKGSLNHSRSMDQEDLMRPTSSSTTSRENENGEGAGKQPLSKTAIPPRARQETSSLDSTHRASNATFTVEGEGDFSSASTDARHLSIHSSSGELERYSAALLAIPAVDLEVTLHDTQVAFLSNLHAAVEDIECSE